MKQNEFKDAGEALVFSTMLMALIFVCILTGLIGVPAILVGTSGLNKLFALIPFAIGLLGASDLYTILRSRR